MTNPLDSLDFGGNDDNPLNALDERNLLNTAVGRRQYTARNVDENLQKLYEVRSQVTDPDRIARLNRLIEAMKKQREGWTRPITEKRTPGSNLARGVAAGVTNAMGGVADLALVPADLLGSETADKLRRDLAENRETVNEVIDPQGKEGLVGDVAGGIAGSALPYGAAASGISKITGLAARLAEAKAAAGLGTRIFAHAAENLATGVPINALQAVGMKEATWQDKLKQFAVAEGGDIVFGAAFGAKKPKLALDVKERSELPVPEAAAEAQAMVKKGQDRIDAKKAFEALVAEKWNTENPSVKWDNLNRDARIAYRKQVKESLPKVGEAPKADEGGEAGPSGTAPLPPKVPTGGTGIGGEGLSLEERLKPDEPITLDQVNKGIEDLSAEMAKADPNDPEFGMFKSRMNMLMSMQRKLRGEPEPPLGKTPEAGSPKDVVRGMVEKKLGRVLNDTELAAMEKAVEGIDINKVSPEQVTDRITSVIRSFEAKIKSKTPGTRVSDWDDAIKEWHSEGHTTDSIIDGLVEDYSVPRDIVVQYVAEFHPYAGKGGTESGSVGRTTDEIAHDWNGIVYDYKNFPSQRKDLQKFLDRYGLDPSLLGKKWEEIGPEEQRILRKAIDIENSTKSDVTPWDQRTVDKFTQEAHRSLGLDPDEIADQLINDLGFDPDQVRRYIDRTYPNWKYKDAGTVGDLRSAMGQDLPESPDIMWKYFNKDERLHILREAKLSEKLADFGWDSHNLNEQDKITEALKRLAKQKNLPSKPGQENNNFKLRGEGAPPPKQFWDMASNAQREMLASEFIQDAAEKPDLHDEVSAWLEERGGQNVNLNHLKWEDLPPQFQDHINKRILDIYGEPSVDVGKTVYEPSANERAARGKLPEDTRQELIDLVIDAEVGDWSEPRIQHELDSLAARNEVDRSLVDDALREMGLHQTNINSDKANPLSALEPQPGTPPSTPSIPEPATEPSLPTNLPRSDRLNLAGKSLDELDGMLDAVYAKLDANPNDAAAVAELKAIGEAKIALKAGGADVPVSSAQEAGQGIPPEVAAQAEAALREAQGLVPKDKDTIAPNPANPMEQIIQRPSEEAGPQRMDPLAFQKLARTSPRKLSDTDLDALIDETGYRISDGADPDADAAYKAIQDKLVAERASRRPPPIDLRIPPAAFGFAVGFTYGITHPDDENSISNALMWGAIGAGVAYGGAKAFSTWEAARAGKNPPQEMYPGQNSMNKFISYEGDRKGPKISAMAQARRQYTGFVRGTAGLEHIVDKLGGKALPAYQNFAKLATIFGRWVGKAEHWLTKKPVIDGPDGNPIYLDALALSDIRSIAKGEIENLDELAVAATTLENFGKPNWKPPIDIARAQLIYSNAPDYLHNAAKELRKYHLALADALVDAGVLGPESRNAFESEAWYTALQRVFGEGSQKGEVESASKAYKNTIVSPNPVKSRAGGSTLKIKSPFEVANEMTSRYIRAAEYNKIKQLFVSFVRAQPADVRNSLMMRVDKKAVKTGQIDVLAKELRETLPSIDQESAQRLALAFGEDLDPSNPVMTAYEEGVLRSYRVNQTVFDGFKHMMPSEMNTWLAMLSAPTRLASKMIVYNPAFIASQSFIDTFQSALQSRYGFTPGISSIQGWLNIFSKSPEYQKLLAAGGPATIQSLSYVNKATARAAVEASGRNALETAANQIKELHPWEAYKTLAHTVAEAARVGEAMRAMSHGESAVDAVYAAWHVVGNTRMQGNFAAMRAFNLLTLFSRPAISAIDEAATKAGINPFRAPAQSHGVIPQMMREMGFKSDRVMNAAEFWTKGFAYIGLPTIALWALGKDDQEIQQLRKTESGRKYWWARVNGTIIKVRKPHVLGQIFGSTLEDILDKNYSEDPNTASWVGGLMNDAAFNTLPQFGVIPLSLWANKQVGLGMPIVPSGEENLDPALQGDLNASNPARIVAQALDPISSRIAPDALLDTGKGLRTAMSPAGIDFMARNVAGMMGDDGIRLLDWLINEQRINMPPAANELPVVGRFFGSYPAMNTKPVRDFYRNAQRVEQAQKSMNELIQHKPDLATQYMVRHETELGYAPLYQKQRERLSEYHRILEDAKSMLRAGDMTATEYRTLEKEVLTQIITLTQETVANSRELQIQ